MGLNNEEVRKIVSWVEDQGLSSEQAGKDFDISQRRIQHLAKKCRETGEIPKLKKRARKP